MLQRYFVWNTLFSCSLLLNALCWITYFWLGTGEEGVVDTEIGGENRSE